MTCWACLKRRSSYLYALNRYAAKMSCFLLLYCVVLCCLVSLCCVVLHWLRLGVSPEVINFFAESLSDWAQLLHEFVLQWRIYRHEAETLCSPLNLLSLTYTVAPTLPSDLHYSACLWLTILSCIWHNSWVSKSSLDLWLRADWIWLKKRVLLLLYSLLQRLASRKHLYFKRSLNTHENLNINENLCAFAHSWRFIKRTFLD